MVLVILRQSELQFHLYIAITKFGYGLRFNGMRPPQIGIADDQSPRALHQHGRLMTSGESLFGNSKSVLLNEFRSFIVLS